MREFLNVSCTDPLIDTSGAHLSTQPENLMYRHSKDKKFITLGFCSAVILDWLLTDRYSASILSKNLKDDVRNKLLGNFNRNWSIATDIKVQSSQYDRIRTVFLRMIIEVLAPTLIQDSLISNLQDIQLGTKYFLKIFLQAEQGSTDADFHFIGIEKDVDNPNKIRIIDSNNNKMLLYDMKDQNESLESFVQNHFGKMGYNNWKYLDCTLYCPKEENTNGEEKVANLVVGYMKKIMEFEDQPEPDGSLKKHYAIGLYEYMKFIFKLANPGLSFQKVFEMKDQSSPERFKRLMMFGDIFEIYALPTNSHQFKSPNGKDLGKYKYSEEVIILRHKDTAKDIRAKDLCKYIQENKIRLHEGMGIEAFKAKIAEIMMVIPQNNESKQKMTKLETLESRQFSSTAINVLKNTGFSVVGSLFLIMGCGAMYCYNLNNSSFLVFGIASLCHGIITGAGYSFLNPQEKMKDIVLLSSIYAVIVTGIFLTLNVAATDPNALQWMAHNIFANVSSSLSNMELSLIISGVIAGFAIVIVHPILNTILYTSFNDIESNSKVQID